MYYTYIATNKWNNVLYAGSTKDLVERMFHHKKKILSSSFTARYNVNKLVWYQQFDSYLQAYRRERAIKRWRRHWKIELIERENPNWKDLSEGWDFSGFLALDELI